MANSDEPKNRTKKTLGAKMLGIKNMWRNMFSNKKGRTNDTEAHVPQHHSFPPGIKKDSPSVNMVDIMEEDKDRIRTSCKSCSENLPEFPSKEEVRKRIEEAHKYYGIKCVLNYYVTGGNSEQNQEPLPSWYYILERPLVEQYVLMNNYIRKLSMEASLKSQEEVIEPNENEDEEEVSSISSQSDYSDFPSDSKLLGVYKKNKRKRTDAENDYRRNVTTDECSEIRPNRESEVVTITTKDYDIVIRGPKSCFETGNDDSDTAAGENIPDDDESSEDQLDMMRETALSSGDHLPDMKDFDLSYNLSQCTTIKPPRPGQSYYHWSGNSCPTKTPLLNSDTRPPRRQGPSSSMDFWSFRNFSFSPEFIQMCDASGEPPDVRELRENTPLERKDHNQTSSQTNDVSELQRQDNDIENGGENLHPTTSSDKDEDQLNCRVSQTHLNESERGGTASTSLTSVASVDTKIPAYEDKRIEED